DRVLHGQEHAGPGPLVGGHVQDVLALERHLAPGHLVAGVAGQGVGQGRLAGAVGAHQGVDPPGLDGQGDTPQDLLVLHVDVGVLDHQGRIRHRFFFAPHGFRSSASLAQSSGRSTSTSSPSTRTGKICTGRTAGGESGSPVSRSKRLPCRAHSIVWSSTQPSDSGYSSWLHWSITARTEPSPRRIRATASSSPSSTRNPWSGSSSEIPASRTKGINRPPPPWPPGPPGPPGGPPRPPARPPGPPPGGAGRRARSPGPGPPRRTRTRPAAGRSAGGCPATPGRTGAGRRPGRWRRRGPP